MRVSLALSKIRITPWPFKNRILVRERNPITGLTETHLIDHWRYLGGFRSQMDLFDQYDTRHEVAFDIDTYKLLVSALNKPARKLEIIETP